LQLLERVNRLLRGSDLCAGDKGSSQDEEIANRDVRAHAKTVFGPTREVLMSSEKF
jgi:hypothetical protein